MIKRTRPRSNAMRTNMNKPQQNGTFTAVADDRQELRLKTRNHYQQQLDKYSNMARESLRSGDRVDAEIHFQYAEHYLRQLNERIRYDTEQQQQQAQRQQQRDFERNERMKQQQAQRQQQQQKQAPAEQNDTSETSSVPEQEVVQETIAASGQPEDGEQKQPNRRARPYFRRNRTTTADDSAPSLPQQTQTSSHASDAV